MNVKKNGNPSICTCENGKYLGSIIGDSVIVHDEIIAVTKTVPTKIVPAKTIPTKTIPTKTVTINFSEKKVNCQLENFYISLAFLLITIAVLIAVSIYCYFIKYQLK